MQSIYTYADEPTRAFVAQSLSDFVRATQHANEPPAHMYVVLDAELVPAKVVILRSEVDEDDWLHWTYALRTLTPGPVLAEFTDRVDGRA